MKIVARESLRRGKGLSATVKDQISAYLFLLLPIIFVALFKYIPIAVGLFISFFKIDIVNLPGDFVGLDNYIRAFKDPLFYQTMWHNIKFFLYGLAFAFWPPILLALLINETRKLRPAFRIIYFLPSIAPGIAMTIMWKYMWQPDYGLANYVVSLFGIPPQLWLNDPRLVYFCMSFPGLIIAGGMNMLIYLASLQEVPSEHYEAALIEGAGVLRRVWHISLPAIKNIVGLMFLLNFVGLFNALEGPMVTTGGGPAGATETVLLYAYKKAMNSMDYSYAITLSSIVFFIVLIGTAAKQMLTKED